MTKISKATRYLGTHKKRTAAAHMAHVHASKENLGVSESECSARFSDEGPEDEIKCQKMRGDEYRHKKDNAEKRAMY